MWAVSDSGANKVTSAFYTHMVDESGRLDHTRAAFALRETMRTVKIPFDQRILLCISVLDFMSAVSTVSVFQCMTSVRHLTAICAVTHCTTWFSGAQASLQVRCKYISLGGVGSCSCQSTGLFFFVHVYQGHC